VSVPDNVLLTNRYKLWLDVVVITMLPCVMFTSSPLRILLTYLNIL